MPAHIQLEGYDRPQYVNVQYPWDGQEQVEPGEIPTLFNPVASYLRSFTLERPLDDGRDGVGGLRGRGERDRACGATDATSATRPTASPPRSSTSPMRSCRARTGSAAQVIKWSSGSWLEDQDMYPLLGPVPRRGAAPPACGSRRGSAGDRRARRRPVERRAPSRRSRSAAARRSAPVSTASANWPPDDDGTLAIRVDRSAAVEPGVARALRPRRRGARRRRAR